MYRMSSSSHRKSFNFTVLGNEFSNIKKQFASHWFPFLDALGGTTLNYFSSSMPHQIGKTHKAFMKGSRNSNARPAIMMLMPLRVRSENAIMGHLERSSFTTKESANFKEVLNEPTPAMFRHDFVEGTMFISGLMAIHLSRVNVLASLGC
ncbi:hypothetical protein HAX54_035860 [Datura stramonium]|uniref:Uncharacterized protein n=1 Tax=Datura stramonium TaxID=4076 RepID=A0ABS8VFX5_DATST|nr:hypothetical protein [Datura stramonium]